MTRFKVRAHDLRSGDVIDVFDGDEFIGAVYSTPGRSIRVVSKHHMVVESDDATPQAMVREVTFGPNKH